MLKNHPKKTQKTSNVEHHRKQSTFPKTNKKKSRQMLLKQHKLARNKRDKGKETLQYTNN